MTQTIEKSQKRTKKILTGNHAAAHAFRQARVGVISAYPITPQSPVVEKVSEFVATGKMQAKFVRVESEHSALAVCCAASATGSRVGTATSAHGLELMYEMLPWASGNRLPIIINLATRALGAPWSVWTDHQDFMTVRDVGWIQMFCENNQEIYDTNLQAFKIAEDPRVFLPAIVGYDGYILSHTMMPVILEDQEDVDDFLPPLKHHYNLSDISTVKGIDPVTTPHIVHRQEGTAPGYYEYRYSLQKSLENSIEIIKQVHDEFSQKFGRFYGNGIFKTYMTEDADVIIFAMGSVASQARNVVDKLRQKGEKVGLVSLKLFRPFPAEILRNFLKDYRNIIVFDRDIGYGHEGVLCYELKAALYGLQEPPYIKGFIIGLGGRDINDDQIIFGIKKGLKDSKERKFTSQTEFIGLKLDQLKDYDEKTYFDKEG
ncbi:MAG: pyruvate ferredoxin oxidoreductase [Candidatus Lokiarchaeota archaeon]|nr:pyruvate ferredoxin oxidoreductase [Candidatus Lokiarchaeota archaeon]MBD3202116.1 pyruvate ferredoxin oxidoreductase [Candidatus Lokiarchaeota archaeon]